MRAIWFVIVMLFFGLTTGVQAQSIAITFDDGFHPSSAGEQAVIDNANILATLKQHGIRSMLFPGGSALGHPENMALVREWGKAGHALGNHTYRHGALSQEDTKAYLADTQRAHDILKSLEGWCPRLRFPYLDEGATPTQHNEVMQWLGQHGYGVAGVTITLPDWDLAERYLTILKNGTPENAKTFEEDYIKQIWEEIQTQDIHWQKVLGRSPAHVLLLHANHLNAEVLPQLLNLLKQNEWTVIDPVTAFKDPIYQRSYRDSHVEGSQPINLPVPVCY